MRAFTALMAGVDSSVQRYTQVLGRVSRYREGETFFGCNIRCDLREFQQRRIYLFHQFEPNLTSLVQTQVGPGDVFLDLGANIGYFSMLASRRVGPTGKVIAVEASPTTFETLAANLERNGCQNVTAVNVAATADETTVEILQGHASNSGTSSIAVLQQGEGIRGRPILDILGDDAARVTFMKIDIEGSEQPVLEDLLEGSSALSPRLTIAVEVSRRSAGMVERFARAGFMVFGLPNDYRYSYLVIRRHLAAGAVGHVELVPLNGYEDRFTDYAFIRA